MCALMKILIQESLISFELDLSELLDVDQRGQLTYRKMLSDMINSSKQRYMVNIYHISYLFQGHRYTFYLSFIKQSRNDCKKVDHTERFSFKFRYLKK